MTIPLGRPLDDSQPDGSHESSDLILVATEIRDLGPDVGHGVYLAQSVVAGTPIAIFGGVAMRSVEFDQLPETRRSSAIQVDDDVFLVPTGAPTAATLINHSCEPTCRLDGQIVVVAARDLEPGDAVTYDYATSDALPYDEFECQCGAPSCRLKVTGNDWMLPELQQRYEGWFSPYLARRIGEIRRS